MDITKLFEIVNERIDTLIRRVTRLEKIPTPEIEAWQNATLQNSWVNFSVSYSPASYYKDPFGIVHIRGYISGGVTTANTTLFTLPSGYRPEYNYTVPVYSQGSTNSLGFVTVAANGNVSIASGNNTLFIIDNIHFRAV